MNMIPKRIGVDLDEVLCPMLVHLKRYQERRSNKKYIFPHKKYEYNYSKLFKMNELDAKYMVRDFYESYEAFWMPAMENSRPVMQQLSKTNKMYIITGRQYYARDLTEEFVDKYFKGVFSDVILTNSYSLRGDEVAKSEYCKYLGIDVLIDDSESTLTDCINNDIEGILFGKYPWNCDSEIKRIEEWPSLYKQLISQSIC